MTPEEKQRRRAPMSRDAAMNRLTEACRLLNAIELLEPANFADWLEHLGDLFGNLDERLGRIEKRLDAAGIPLLADGIPDDEVPAYLALYASNPLTEHQDDWTDMWKRLAAWRDAEPAEGETSS